MLLSIVMMVKDEEKFLEKSLKSLKPIIERLDSELIILDTGSKDKTVEIAKKFTSNVYFQKWNEDFSDMRNKSISYSKGEWILIVDADEILTKYEDLLMFFETGMYKEYNSASVNLKNIFANFESDERLTTTVTLMRLFRSDNFKYEGKIHEQPIYEEPIYKNIAEFDHYGYFYEDEEFKLNKTKRNGILLCAELKEDPDNPYINYQMGKNLVSEGEEVESLEYIEKAYKLYKKYGDAPEYVYTSLANRYIVNGKYKEAEELCTRYITKDKNNIDIYYYLGNVQKSLGKIKNSIISFERYIYLVDNYDLSTQSNSLFADGNCISNRDNIICEIIFMYYAMEEYHKVIEKYNSINKYIYKRQVNKFLFASLEKVNKLDEILEYYNKLPDSNVERDSFFYAVEQLIKSLKKEKRLKLYSMLSTIDGNYGKLNHIRLKNEISLDECKEILKNEKNPIYGVLINIAYENKLDIFNIVNDLDLIWIEKYLGYAIKYHNKFAIDLYNYIKYVPNTFEIEKIKIYKVISKLVLDNCNLEENKYIELFYFYIVYSYEYIRFLYKEFEDTDLLKYLCNDIDRFTIEFKGMFYNNASMDNLKYINKLKDLINEYPYYKRIIRILIRNFEESLNESDEFKKLKDEFISNIENMINNGELKSAKILINEYSRTFKDDARILNIKSIMLIIDEKFNEAEFMLKKAYSLDISNEDTLHNIKYLHELKYNIK